MDHSEAIRLQAVEKYVLGELHGALREEFEEHFFDCPGCARDIKAAAVFVDTSREVLRQEGRKAAVQERVAPRRDWFAWLKPIVAVPAFAVLLLVIAYQNSVTIPQAKKEAAVGTGQVITSSFSLQMANVRGGEEVKVAIHPNEGFALKFDFTPSQKFEGYTCQLQDESGRVLLQKSMPGSSMNKEAQLVVRDGLVKPGKYNLVFTGAPGTSGQGNGAEVLRLSFSVEFLP